MAIGELKKGTAPLLVLALLESGPRHGYELSKLIRSAVRRAVRREISPDDRAVLKGHARESVRMLKGRVPDDVRRIAATHYGDRRASPDRRHRWRVNDRRAAAQDQTAAHGPSWSWRLICST